MSTRRVKKITTELCGREFGRQTVSNLTEKLDEQVQARVERPLEEEYPFLLADATGLKIQHHEAVRSATALIVVGISEEDRREILGLKIVLRETGESWKELFQELKDRGLRRVGLATSDAHEGLESALREASRLHMEPMAGSLPADTPHPQSGTDYTVVRSDLEGLRDFGCHLGSGSRFSHGSWSI